MPMNELSLHKNSIPRKRAKGGQETGTPNIAEDQRKKKKWKFWDREGHEGRGGLSRRAEAPNTEYWGGGQLQEESRK